MNFYEKEMRMLFGDNDIIHDARFCGRTMLGRLDDELRVKLQLMNTHVSGQYNAVKAAIINRTEGVVDQQVFRFADIIGKKRMSYGEIEPHIWDDGRPEWYVPITVADRERIADAVIGYVGMYQDEGMEMGGMNL